MNMSKSSIKDAIIKKCLDCCGYAPLECKNLTEQDLKEADYERVNCLSTTCPLYEFRLGTNPYKKRKQYNMTDEERERRKGNFKCDIKISES